MPISWILLLKRNRRFVVGAYKKVKLKILHNNNVKSFRNKIRLLPIRIGKAPAHSIRVKTVFKSKIKALRRKQSKFEEQGNLSRAITA
jgi:hypothetical protein